jgi:hypothetical protein
MDTLARWIENGTTISHYRIVDALTHPGADAVLRFWAERPPGGIRIGHDIPSRSIAGQLGNILVYEMLKDRPDARVYLAGANLRRRFGRDITGLLMSELFTPDAFKVRFDALTTVLASGEPRLAEIVHTSGDIQVLRLELLALPAIAPNGVDRWALTFAFYF